MTGRDWAVTNSRRTGLDEVTTVIIGNSVATLEARPVVFHYTQVGRRVDESHGGGGTTIRGI